ncbi:hypothetical protein MACJ_003895 [Theileria orientalis]|uniref:ABC transporter n=1 Tax=Theileria orientalis TaxID=68886 RepID=A0A976SKX0_THEOR|nr:hypothetical protein MACJ_003895 [Theileria orientalis]
MVLMIWSESYNVPTYGIGEKYLNMNLSSSKVKKINEPEHCFWESELYFKSYFKNIKNRSFRYYDYSSFLKYFFFHWLNKWTKHFSCEFVEPYKYHPLPVSDQVLKWYPIFSKHISDGLARLESFECNKSESRDKKSKKPYKSIIFRALVLTFWKRTLFLIVGLIVVNILSMSTAVLVKKVLTVLNDKSLSFIKTFLLLLTIIVFQIADGLLLEIFNFHMNRLNSIVHCLTSVVVFQHAIPHRRKFFNNVNGSNSLNVCNKVLHSCSPDSDCSKNPLFCPALRHQSREVSSQIFNFESADYHFVAMGFQSLRFFIDFLTNFIYGIILTSVQIKDNLSFLYLIGALFIIFMVVIEVLTSYIFKWVLFLSDTRISKCNHILFSLSRVKKMLYDDIAINIITRSRNNELSLFYVYTFFTLFNMSLYTSCINVSFYFIKRSFVKSINKASVITDIDTAGFMTTFYIYMRIITSLILIPNSIKLFGMGYISLRRLEKFIKNCSPNFYISENKYTGSTKTSSDIIEVTTQIPNDVVVYYKDATFTWVHARDDLLNKKYEPFLKNINFELKFGEMAIVTGAQGSGKSNFIKSILGEMTLVRGSMAVVPLHTSMPIFYASQDIWIQQGTIRSNITFGYKFDEQLYNPVLKAVELEFDISTWDKGDLRVVSDNAHSLSGGQRVRMELARAVYAYLVFHKVNKEYNNSECSFLMCLDASFHGLDPYVSKTIFNNLFNVKTGLLAKDDLSVVLTTTKQILDICSKASDLTNMPNPPVYQIKNQTLQFHSNLHDILKDKKINNQDYMYLSASSSGPCRMNYLTNDMLRLCSSDAATRLGRMEVTRSKYSKSFKSYTRDELAGIKFNPYLVYVKPAPALFLLYLFLSVAFNVLDNVKLVLSTNLSDHITKNINQYKDGKFVDLSEIKAKSNFTFKTVVLFILIIIILSVLATLSMTTGSLVSSRKIHEYSINSIFKNSSSVIKIKKDVSRILTYFFVDINFIDYFVGSQFTLFSIPFIQSLINILTLFYLIPVSIPLVTVTIGFVYYFVLKRYVNSNKSMFFAYLESCVHVNSSVERAISGSQIYRSFNREFELINSAIEHRDYRARSRFMSFSIVSWSTTLFNWMFSFTTLLIFSLVALLDRFTGFNFNVGYFGLGLSLCVNVLKSFDKLTLTLGQFDMAMCSVERFRLFIPPGEKFKFMKFLNTHEEILTNPISGPKFDRKQLLKRRAVEFKSENKKFYGLRKLFYHPKIQILDVGRYLTSDHSGVELRDVCVYTKLAHTPESMILKHLNVSSHRSEIIGIIGRTGAGKTTLLSVLQNIAENRSGQVLLDGKELNDIPEDVLSQIIGVIPQLPFVFKGWTIRTFLDPRKLFSDDDIKYALNLCGLLNFVSELQGGKKLDTVLIQDDVSSSYKQYKNKKQENIKSGEITSTGIETDMLLSNSQLRTLWLARLVLYRHFYRMIVVDEPPEEDLLDESSTKDDIGVPIYDLLEKYFSHCTTFVTAHEVNTLKKCTSVWVMHHGSLVRTCKASDIAANESIASIIEKALENKL